jgi:sugar phosphate isomerase/epimerase
MERPAGFANGDHRSNDEEATVRLSLPAWSLPSATLAEVCGIARTLGFDGIDVGHIYASGLDRSRLLSEPDAIADDLRAHGVPVASYFHHFGDGAYDRNLARADSRDANLADLAALARFCESAQIGALLVLPGMLEPGRTLHESLTNSAETLRLGVEVVGEHGVQLMVEPHVRGILETPSAVLDLLEKAPGLRLALDPSHFICLGYPQEAVEDLLAFASHVHLRNARSGRLQERMAYGTINFDVLLARLVSDGFDGWISPEPLHQDFIDAWRVDVVTELIALRDIVRRWMPYRN